MSYGAFGAKIKVIGVGGGGGNAVNTMIRSGLDGVEFIVANTDSQALVASLAHHKIQLGKELTKGLGAGADPDIGRDAALEDRHEIQELLSDADMVFITAGMGGGTGTGAAAVVAQIARELGALTVAVVTKPFTFEGKRRRKHAEMGISRLREAVDTLITIPNQRLLQIATPDLSMLDAFKLADNVLVNAVRGISDIINTPGLINVDFADVKTVMSSMGHALMGIGYGTGADRSLVAAKQAISSPLLEDIDIEGATGILINITAGTNVSIMEVNNACMVIQEAAHEDANIIFGAVIDETLGEEIRITVIATGFPVDESAFVEEYSGMSLPQVRSVSQTLPSPSHMAHARHHNQASSLAAQMARPFNSSRPLIQQPIVKAPTPQPASQTLPKLPSMPHQASPLGNSMGADALSPAAFYSNRDVVRTKFDDIPVELPQTPQPQLDDREFEANQTFAPAAPQKPAASFTPPSHVLDVFQEARELTDWSLQGFDLEQNLEAPSEGLSGFAAHESPGANVFFSDEGLESAPELERSAPSFSNQDNASANKEVRAGAQAAGNFWGIEDAKPEAVTMEIDRKIDEALALAGRFNPSQGASLKHSFDDLDDLDLPAFLRHGSNDSFSKE